jgi:hypothetical protein
VGSATSVERSEVFAAATAESALGNDLTPTLIFDRKLSRDQVIRDESTGCIGVGKIRVTKFVTFIKHFISHPRHYPENQILLVHKTIPHTTVKP